MGGGGRESFTTFTLTAGVSVRSSSSRGMGQDFPGKVDSNNNNLAEPSASLLGPGEAALREVATCLR